MADNTYTTLEAIHSRAQFNDEAAVKRVVRRMLDKYGYFSFMPPANAYGKSGISDVLALGNGRFIAIECKFKYNKPTPMQLTFGKDVEDAGGMFVVVNEKNLVITMNRVIHFLTYGVDLGDDAEF